MRLRALDPTATFTYHVGDAPSGAALDLVCRYLTVRQALAYRESRREALAAGLSDPEYAERLLATLRMIVVEPDVERLAEVLTFIELATLTREVYHAQELSEAETGESTGPSRSDSAPSAPTAAAPPPETPPDSPPDSVGAASRNRPTRTPSNSVPPDQALVCG